MDLQLLLSVKITLKYFKNQRNYLKNNLLTKIYMEKYLKWLLENIHNKTTKEILENHITNISVDDFNKVLITIDKRYVFNDLNSHEHIWNIILWVKKTFWDDSETILKLQSHLMKDEDIEHHDREINVPYMIHYK